MRGVLLKGFFKCHALRAIPNAWTRKRRSFLPSPPLKRQKRLPPPSPEGDDAALEKEEGGEPLCSENELSPGGSKESVDNSEESVDTSEESAGGSEELPPSLSKPKEGETVATTPPARENPSLYPSVVYESNVATVKLAFNQGVTLDGCAMVQVEEGQASMLGYSLPRGTDVLVCSSSKLAELITIEARSVSEIADETSSTLDTMACQLRFTSHSLGQHVFTSNVVSERSFSFKLEFVGSMGKRIPDQDSLDVHESDSDSEELESDSEASDSDGDEMEDGEVADTIEGARKRKGGLGSSPSAKKMKVDSYSAATSIPRDWREAVETIARSDSVPVVAICGAKNVGKSTFARFLVNSLLNRHKEVAYLDTDVGQPEFTVPGCVSLHILDIPVVGPPAMHLRTPERCFFYGDVSPKSNPMMYVEHVADLFNYFRQQQTISSTSVVPLVINTHGWVKGIGYDVIVDILNTSSPTHVVQLLASSEKKNLPRDKFWNATSSALTIHVESAVEKLSMPRSARSAPHLRAARLLAYFQQCFGENSAPFPYREDKLFAQTAMALVRDTPYEVPFSALKIRHLHSEVPPSESFRCINAAIVGLGVTSIEKDTEGERPSFPLCLGLGIVKAVDITRGVFYVSTPVPQEKLQLVDVLLQGRVEIPVPLLTAKGYKCPYLRQKSQLVEGVGAGAMKSTSKLSTKRVP